jgi:hypothetical protein
MFEIRLLTSDDVHAAADLTARIFAAEAEYDGMLAMMKAAMTDCPYMPPELCFGGFLDGRLIAKWQVLDFKTRIGRTTVRMAGIQGVVAEPDENHKGYPRQIATQALPMLGPMGFDIALGFAQRGALYRRIGAVPVMADYELTLDVRRLPPLRNDPFHVWTEAELPRYMELYAEANKHRSGSMVRTAEMWPWMMRRPDEVHICDDGYIGIRRHADRIEIREISGLGDAFHEIALAKLAAIAKDAGHQLVHGAVPADHPLTLAAIPYGAKITTAYTKKSGCLALPISPLRLLSRLESEFEDRLQASRFHDEQIELVLRCVGGESRLSLNPAGRQTRKIEFSLSPAAAMQLAFGYRPLRGVVLEERRRAEKEGFAPTSLDERDLLVLETLFPHGHPFMWYTDRY